MLASTSLMTEKLFDRFCDASHEVTSREKSAQANQQGFEGSWDTGAGGAFEILGLAGASFESPKIADAVGFNVTALAGANLNLTVAACRRPIYMPPPDAYLPRRRGHSWPRHFGRDRRIFRAGLLSRA